MCITYGVKIKNIHKQILTYEKMYNNDVNNYHNRKNNYQKMLYIFKNT